MLAAAKAAGQIKEGGKGANQHKGATIPNGNSSSFTLKEAGIDPKLSMRSQQVAAIPQKEFEKKVVELKTSTPKSKCEPDFGCCCAANFGPRVSVIWVGQSLGWPGSLRGLNRKSRGRAALIKFGELGSRGFNLRF
jgi:hypothetical protein